MSQGNILKICYLEDFSNILTDNEKVITKYTASWCEPCKYIAPTYKLLAKQFGDIIFTEIDIDEIEYSVFDSKNIFSIPTFVIYVKGVEMDRLSGLSASRLESLLQKWATHLS